MDIEREHFPRLEAFSVEMRRAYHEGARRIGQSTRAGGRAANVVFEPRDRPQRPTPDVTRFTGWEEDAFTRPEIKTVMEKRENQIEMLTSAWNP
jgi:hypothetical protein